MSPCLGWGCSPPENRRWMCAPAGRCSSSLMQPPWVAPKGAERGRGTATSLFAFSHPFLKGLWETNLLLVFSSPAVVTPGGGRAAGARTAPCRAAGDPMALPQPQALQQKPQRWLQATQQKQTPKLSRHPHTSKPAPRSSTGRWMHFREDFLPFPSAAPLPAPSRGEGQRSTPGRALHPAASLGDLLGTSSSQELLGSQEHLQPACLPQTRPRRAAAQSQPRPVPGCARCTDPRRKPSRRAPRAGDPVHHLVLGVPLPVPMGLPEAGGGR